MHASADTHSCAGTHVAPPVWYAECVMWDGPGDSARHGPENRVLWRERSRIVGSLRYVARSRCDSRNEECDT
ncbi:MAG: hypothetical protein NVSMB27_23710 [Ktedonobacteraceae bacterium]